MSSDQPSNRRHVARGSFGGGSRMNKCSDQVFLLRFIVYVVLDDRNEGFLFCAGT